MLTRPSITLAVAALISVAIFLSCESIPFLSKPGGTPGEVQDEARRANLDYVVCNDRFLIVPSYTWV